MTKRICEESRVSILCVQEDKIVTSGGKYTVASGDTKTVYSADKVDFNISR